MQGIERLEIFKSVIYTAQVIPADLPKNIQYRKLPFDGSYPKVAAKFKGGMQWREE